jgi:transposase InsO family protein
VRQFKSDDVLAALAELFVTRGPPGHVRSGNGPAFIATSVQEWLDNVGVKTLCIAPGSPWENGYGSTGHCAISCSTVISSLAHRVLDPDRSLAAT